MCDNSMTRQYWPTIDRRCLTPGSADILPGEKKNRRDGKSVVMSPGGLAIGRVIDQPHRRRAASASTASPTIESLSDGNTAVKRHIQPHSYLRPTRR